MRLKAVQLLANEQLPMELRDYSRNFDSGSMNTLMTTIAKSHNSDYAKILKKLADIGRHASWRQGETLTLEDLKPVVDRDTILKEMDQLVDEARANAVDDKDFTEQRDNIWTQFSDKLERATAKEALKKGNNLAYAVLSGARGKNAQLKAMLTTPGVYQDAKGKLIPMFIRRSFGEGLRPAEYLASTYGTRTSVLSTKRATAKGGFFSKLLQQAAAPLIVTERDCGVANGIDLPLDDGSLRNRVLARDTDGYPAGTIVDREVLNRLRRSKSDHVVVRSAMTCQAQSGVCAKCLGAEANGKLPHIGTAAGITGAQAIGEPICLHEDTMVRMADWSEKKIKDIKPGEMVLGADLDGYLSPVRVVNVFHNGLRECYRTRVRKGKGAKSDVIEMISTKEHKVLSFQGKDFKKAKPTIQPIGKRLSRHCVYLNKEVVTAYGHREPLAALFGVLAGDGCYNGGVGSKGLALSCYDPELERWVRDFIQPLGLVLRPMQSGEFRLSMVDQYKSMERIEGRMVRNKIKAALIREKLWGQGSGQKQLPASIHTWDNASVAAYIGGIIATDGWITGKGQQVVIGMGSNSKPLLEGLKFLLEKRFGIYCSRISSKTKKRKTGGSYDPNHTLTVSGKPETRAFAGLIPIPGCKQRRLDDAIARLNSSPYDRGRYAVISQEYVGTLDTWDIEVDNETHLFALANCLIVSNTQGALNTKHTGGQASGKKEYSGFDVINRFAQSPETFEDRAVVSEKDGVVERIDAAPQGGSYVVVSGEKHYVPPGYPILSKPGQKVEQGDQLAEGLIDPGDMVRLRGIGEARNYYAERFKKILDDSGMQADRRNTEIMARAAIDHVTITGDEGPPGTLPDDVVSYNRIASGYEPDVNTVGDDPERLQGKFLQVPALHYTIGTRITPRIALHMKSRGFGKVYAADNPPPFEPEMVRLQSAAHNNPDWLAGQHTSYLKKQLSDHAIRGSDTNVEQNTHFVPRLAIGTGFGEKVTTTGKF